MLLYAGARSVGRAFWHRLSGVHELCKRVRPDGAALFLHRPSGALELPQACSPLTGGKVFTEPQRGATPYPRRWAKRKDNLRFSFLFELLPFPCFLIWRRFPICDRFENRERQSGYHSVSFSAFSQFTDSVLLHIRFTLRWVRHNRAARFVSALLQTGPAKINCPRYLNS